MPVPKPRKGESTRTFISRCISTMSRRDPGRPHKQIIAMCHTAARSAGRKTKRKPRKRR